MESVKELIQQAGVVAVPGFGFFHRNLYLEKFPPVDYSFLERYISLLSTKAIWLLLHKKLASFWILQGFSNYLNLRECLLKFDFCMKDALKRQMRIAEMLCTSLNLDA